MAMVRLALSRDQILAHRRRVGALDERLPAGAASLRRAAWAGLTDSMPRAAVLSVHARVHGTEPGTWEDPAFVQVWGLRYSAYVVPAVDRGVFTLARLPDHGAPRRRADDIADRLDAFLAGRRMDAREAGRGLGIHPNGLRYAAPTGRVLIRWDGARQPLVWTVPPPDLEPADARLELARRYLHVFGIGTADGFADWAGLKPPRSRATFEALAGSLTPVRTPVGDASILSADEDGFRAPTASPSPARLLPSGDTFYLLQGADRALLLPDARQRAELWTSRVWPGAVLVNGDVIGTWRRAGATLTVVTWRRLSAAERTAVEEEAASFPLPDARGAIKVSWEA